MRADPSSEGLASYFRDISSRKKNEEQLRPVSDRLLDVLAIERAALAHELHDEFGQVLTAVKLQLQALAQKGPSPHLEDCVALVDQLLQQVRSLSLDLRPSQLHDLGLAAALRSHLARLARQTGRNIRFECGDDVPRLTGQHPTACFRIAQEAVTNALRHTSAGEINVALHRDGAFLTLVVRDDGGGFDTQAMRADALKGGSTGRLGMEDRAHVLDGTFDVESRPGAGTTVRARIPLEAMARSRT